MEKDLKPFFNYLESNNISKEETLNLLKNCDKLTSDEKNLIYLYRYPRNLGDRELPSRIMSYRQLAGLPPSGVLVPNLGETSLLIEAYRTKQYERFMKHLFIAFGDPSKISPISGQEIDECPICGKKLYEYDQWSSLVAQNPGDPEGTKKEYLSFGSTDSGITICLDCLTQLVNASEILGKIDPSFLDWRIRDQVSETWSSFKK